MDKGLGQLKHVEMEELLMAEVIGRIGCHANGRTLVVPITYAYDGARIVGHSAVGEKIALMRQNPNVCFEVDHVRDMRNWQSVLVQGRYRELKGVEASVAMSFLVEKVAPKLPSETAMLGHSRSLRPRSSVGEADSVVFCIEVVEMSGRYERWASS